MGGEDWHTNTLFIVSFVKSKYRVMLRRPAKFAEPRRQTDYMIFFCYTFIAVVLACATLFGRLGTDCDERVHRKSGQPSQPPSPPPNKEISI
jgi:hypothetical protein